VIESRSTSCASASRPSPTSSNRASTTAGSRHEQPSRVHP
jgi:hypothetical protein